MRGEHGDLSTFIILRILALDFGELEVRGEGKTDDFTEFTRMVEIPLEEQFGQYPF